MRLTVPDALRPFLHRTDARRELERTGELVVPPPADETSSLGHVVQSLGLPLTEIEAILRDGTEIAVRDPVPGEARLEVVERRRPQRTPTVPPRFVLDVHLGSLARRMRLLGLDAAYDRDADDDELIARSLEERRVLLTRDHGLLRRRGARWAAYVRGQAVEEQLADVLDRFAPPLRPWTRCVACNGTLAPVDVAEVADQLEPGTLTTYSDFARCTSCGRPYWRGAHAPRLEAVVTDATRCPPDAR